MNLAIYSIKIKFILFCLCFQNDKPEIFMLQHQILGNERSYSWIFQSSFTLFNIAWHKLKNNYPEIIS